MKPLVKKTGKLGLLKLELVLGALIMAAALLTSGTVFAAGRRLYAAGQQL